MLKEPLHQCDVKSVGIVDFGCVPLAEAVGTDALIAQIVAYNPKLLLYCPFCDWENQVIAPDAAAQAVILHVLLNHQRNCKDKCAVFLGFAEIIQLLEDIKRK